MKLQILTPEKTVFDGEAESIGVPGEAGAFEILKGHAPILSTMVPGKMRVVSGKQELNFHVSHGFVEFSHDKGVVLADAAEKPGEIDPERVRAAKERAAKRLEQTSAIDILRAQKALMRALSRERFAQQFPG